MMVRSSCRFTRQSLVRRPGTPSRRSSWITVLGVAIRTVPIADDGDLAAAQAQKNAVERARRSLAEATADAVKANVGYRAVSATLHLDNGRPVAEITLVRGDEWKIVNERLD